MYSWTNINIKLSFELPMTISMHKVLNLKSQNLTYFLQESMGSPSFYFYFFGIVAMWPLSSLNLIRLGRYRLESKEFNRTNIKVTIG